MMDTESSQDIKMLGVVIAEQLKVDLKDIRKEISDLSISFAADLKGVLERITALELKAQLNQDQINSLIRTMDAFREELRSTENKHDKHVDDLYTKIGSCESDVRSMINNTQKELADYKELVSDKHYSKADLKSYAVLIAILVGGNISVGAYNYVSAVDGFEQKITTMENRHAKARENMNRDHRYLINEVKEMIKTKTSDFTGGLQRLNDELDTHGHN